ncbi:MAG: dUTP pyrophosphatase [Clostridium celatum]|nr:dUTP pyrophosphatase [Clostridium celatum]
MIELLFAKVRKNAVIPTKTEENAGRDLYACFDEDYIVILPLETKMIPTGIATAFGPEFYAQIQERGSTGSKGIKFGAGVIDSGYRGEWFVPITNCNEKILIIAKYPDSNEVKRLYPGKDKIIYPYSKAIAQFVMIEVPKFIEKVVSLEDLQLIKSERGLGILGSSGK